MVSPLSVATCGVSYVSCSITSLGPARRLPRVEEPSRKGDLQL